MKINIICENDGWIYGKFIEMFQQYSNHSIFINSKEKCDVTHYLPYYLVPKTPVKPCTSWQSHMEAKDPLRSKFVSAAQTVSIPISHSQKYADIIQKEFGVIWVKNIIPGVDLDVFKRRGTVRTKNDKLIVGYIGRQYTSSNRKNPQLLKQISELPFVEFRTTGGKVKDKDVPKFYSGLDVVVSPATTEGGPMAVQEALAVGVPIVCFEGVGVADEFGHGVIRVPFGNNKEFLSRLDIIHRTKSYLDWRDAGRMNQMRKQVERQTWGRFVRLHDATWEMLCE